MSKWKSLIDLENCWRIFSQVSWQARWMMNSAQLRSNEDELFNAVLRRFWQRASGRGASWGFMCCVHTVWVFVFVWFMLQHPNSAVQSAGFDISLINDERWQLLNNDLPPELTFWTALKSHCTVAGGKTGVRSMMALSWSKCQLLRKNENII